MARGNTGMIARALFLALLCVLLPGPSLSATAQNEPIIFLGDHDFPPYEFLDAGTSRGASVDLLNAIGEVLERPIEIRLMKWLEAQDKVLGGGGHALTLMSKNEERLALYDFSDGTFNITFSLFVKADMVMAFDAAGLEGRRIGVVKGGFPQAFLEEHQPAAELVFVDTLLDGFNKLFLGQLDAIGSATWVGYHALSENDISGIQALPRPFAVKIAGISVPKGNEALVREINRALAEIRRSGRFARIMSKWSRHEVVLLERKEIWAFVAIAALALITLASLVVLSWLVRSRKVTRNRAAEMQAANTVLQEEIAERKRAEDALRDSEEQIRLITDNVPAVIAYMDANQQYRFINKRYEEWFGVSTKEAYGRRVRDVVGEAAYDIVKEKLAKALSGERVAFETSLPSKTAGTRYVQVTYVPHLSHDGGVKGVFVLVTDLTERKRLEDELLRRERLATLGQLTATVSHELRNPLGVIRTSAFILRDGLKEEMPRARRALERVERSVVRCDRIIDEMLDFTRMSDLEPEPTALDDWLAGVIEEQSLPTGIVLRQELRLPGLTVPLDRDRFRRAVINVIDNACQAMRGEGDAETEPAERVLTVRTRARAGRIEVVFEDRGPGIAPDVYERIFEPLYSTKGFGVGLGLPVVKQIMEQHGGGIEIETEEGRGTRVCLWLDRNALAKHLAA